MRRFSTQTLSFFVRCYFSTNNKLFIAHSLTEIKRKDNTVERTDVKIVVRSTVGEESVVIASNAIASCDLKAVVVLDEDRVESRTVFGAVEVVVFCSDFVVFVVVAGVVKALVVPVVVVVAVVAVAAAGIEAAVLVIVLVARVIVAEGIIEVGKALLMLNPAVKGKVDILASYRLLLVYGATVISSSSPKTVIIRGVDDGLSNLLVAVVVFIVVVAAVVFIVFSFFIVIGSKVVFENTVGVVCLIVSFGFEALLGLNSAIGVLAIVLYQRLKLTPPLMLYLNLARLLSTADKVEVDATFTGVVVTVVGSCGNSLATDTSSNLGCSSLTEVMVKALGLRGGNFWPKYKYGCISSSSMEVVARVTALIGDLRRLPRDLIPLPLFFSSGI
uniref:Uncharacterized protein n=1 Tax=Glossina austeni TaxID=7395 RepID=A0A1A9V4B3_GLOAU